MEGSALDLNIETAIPSLTSGKQRKERFVRRNRFKRHNEAKQNHSAPFRVKEAPLVGPAPSNRKNRGAPHQSQSSAFCRESPLHPEGFPEPKVGTKRPFSAIGSSAFNPKTVAAKANPNASVREIAKGRSPRAACNYGPSGPQQGKREVGKNIDPLANGHTGLQFANDTSDSSSECLAEPLSQPPFSSGQAPATEPVLKKSNTSHTASARPSGTFQHVHEAAERSLKKIRAGDRTEILDHTGDTNKKKHTVNGRPSRKERAELMLQQQQTDRPSRKRPMPTSEARVNEYHAKPSQLDQHARTLAASSLDSAKTSNHIFTAQSLDSFPLHPRLLSILNTPTEHHGFSLKTATRIQSAALPSLLGGRSALLCSETGSGKTLAYLLPLLQSLASLDPPACRDEGTRAVIVAPTRELCYQIQEVLSRLVRAFVWMVPGLVTGGEKRKSEKARLRKGVVVLVGTPGRLLDHLQNTKAFDYSAVQWLVLDEVDRLLDLGFEYQVREILGRLRGGPAGTRQLQVVAASATLTEAVGKLSVEVLGGHVQIDARSSLVKEVRAGSTAARSEASNRQQLQNGETGMGDATTEDQKSGNEGDANVLGMSTERRTEHLGQETALASPDSSFVIPVQLAQRYLLATLKLRLPALISFLRTHAAHQKTITFFSTCDSTDFHAALFRSCPWPSNDPIPPDSAISVRSGLLGPGMLVYHLHGDIPQAERLQTFRAFREAKHGVLFCTDVAARGLDLPKVDWIVQYDPPNETVEYIHRVGRTARKGLQGKALLFLLPSEKEYLNVLKSKGLHLSPMPLQQTLLAATPTRFTRFRAPEEVFCIELQQQMEKAVEANSSLLALARRAFYSCVRAYATHPKHLKAIFAVRRSSIKSKVSVKPKSTGKNIKWGTVDRRACLSPPRQSAARGPGFRPVSILSEFEA